MLKATYTGVQPMTRTLGYTFIRGQETEVSPAVFEKLKDNPCFECAEDLEKVEGSGLRKKLFERAKELGLKAAVTTSNDDLKTMIKEEEERQQEEENAKKAEEALEKAKAAAAADDDSNKG